MIDLIEGMHGTQKFSLQNCGKIVIDTMPFLQPTTNTKALMNKTSTHTQLQNKTRNLGESPT